MENIMNHIYSEEQRVKFISTSASSSEAHVQAAVIHVTPNVATRWQHISETRHAPVTYMSHNGKANNIISPAQFHLSQMNLSEFNLLISCRSMKLFHTIKRETFFPFWFENWSPVLLNDWLSDQSLFYFFPSTTGSPWWAWTRWCQWSQGCQRWPWSPWGAWSAWCQSKTSFNYKTTDCDLQKCAVKHAEITKLSMI